MNVNIEGWLEDNGYDITDKSVNDEVWNNIEHEAEQQAQEAIDDDMDNIGQEIVMQFKLKKLNSQSNEITPKELKARRKELLDHPEKGIKLSALSNETLKEHEKNCPNCRVTNPQSNENKKEEK